MRDAPAIREGQKVKARYRGRDKLYPGVITRDRGDGTYDIDYDDGERETRVGADLIEVPAGSSRRSPSPRKSRYADDSETDVGGDLIVGSKVEARYRGRDKWYPGKIARVRLNGTFDINYDDGEKEMGVAKDLVRSLGGGGSGGGRNSRSPMRDAPAIREGQKVKARETDMDERKHSTKKSIRRSHEYEEDSDYMRYRREEEEDSKEARDERRRHVKDQALTRSQELVLHESAAQFKNGEHVACYWYRKSKYSRACKQAAPKPAFVLRYNSDDSYTVELELDSDIIDDVPEECLKNWTTVRDELHVRVKRHEEEDKEGAEKEVADAASVPSVAKAFAMFRLKDLFADAKAAAAMVLKILDNIVRNPDQPKYWRININNEEFNTVVWQYEGGRELLMAVGFDIPKDLLRTANSSGRKAQIAAGIKSFIGLRKPLTEGRGGSAESPRAGSPRSPRAGTGAENDAPGGLPEQTLEGLKLNRQDVEHEMVALDVEGVNLAAVVQEMKIHHSVLEIRKALETLLTIVGNVLLNPHDMRLQRVKKGNQAFHLSVGYLFKSEELMRSIGFTTPGLGLGASGVLSTTAPVGHVKAAPDKMHSTTELSLVDFGNTNNSAGGVYVLNNIGNNFATDAGGRQSHGNHASLVNSDTIRFLYRRKADVELVLRSLQIEVGGGTAAIAGTRLLGDGKDDAKSKTDDLKRTVKDSGKGSKSATAKRAEIEDLLSGTSTTKKSSTGKKTLGTKKKKSKGAMEEPEVQVSPEDLSLQSFIVGASHAQLAQIDMIKSVFHAMDIDNDGVLTASDVKCYFKALATQTGSSGRGTAQGDYSYSDLAVRKWIKDRDIDQDGVVSLVEFVASYAHQLDPSSVRPGNRHPSAAPTAVSTVTAAFGVLRIANSVAEVREAVACIEEMVHRVLDAPNEKTYWRIPVGDTVSDFHRRVGRLFGGVALMGAMGFLPEENGAVLALRSADAETSRAGHTGIMTWDTLPRDVRASLELRLAELLSHRSSLSELGVSNVAAVSTAIGLLGDDLAAAVDWGTAIETIMLIITNIINNPGVAKYSSINTANPTFHRRVGRIHGAISILVALGFAEDESGNFTIAPLDSDSGVTMVELKARRLEIEIGLGRLRDRIHGLKTPAPGAEGAAKTKGDAKSDKEAAGKKEATKKDVRAEVKKPVAKKTGVAPAPAAAPAAPAGPTAAEIAKTINIRVNQAMQEEKNKTVRAEAAVMQQKSIIQELQGQVYDLKDAVTHMKESEEGGRHRSKSPSKAKALRRALPDDDLPVVLPAATPASIVAANAAASGHGSAIAVYSSSFSEATCVTTISNRAGALVGDKKLIVGSVVGFKRNMLVLIGEGPDAECRVIHSISSIVVENPIGHNYPAGTRILGFPNIAKNLAVINKYVSKEFVKSVVDEDLMSAVFTQLDATQWSRRLDYLYAERHMLRHVYTVKALAPVRVSLDSAPHASTRITTTSDHDQLLLSSSCGGVTSIHLGQTLISFVHLFEAARQLGGCVGDCVSMTNLLLCVEHQADAQSSNLWKSVFQRLAEEHRLDSYEIMIYKFSCASEAEAGAAVGGSVEQRVVTWTGFCNLVRPTACTLSDHGHKTGTSPTDSAHPHVLLERLFMLHDCDGDGALWETEVLALFAELDGTLPTKTAVVDILAEVTGRYSEDWKYNFAAVVHIREIYASRTHYCTLLQGCRLEGVHVLQEVAFALIEKQLRTQDSEQGGDGSNPHATTLSCTNLLTIIPERLLAAHWHLGGTDSFAPAPRGRALKQLLLDHSEEVNANAHSCAADLNGGAQRLVQWLSGSDGGALCGGGVGALVGSQPCTWFAPGVGTGAAAIKVVQVLSCPVSKLVYALSSDGLVRVLDGPGGRLLYSQRVIWAEAVLADSPGKVSVEGNAKHGKWLRDCGFVLTASNSGSGHSASSAALQAAQAEKRMDTLGLSYLVSLFLTTYVPDYQILSADKDTGLVVVNNSVHTHALCIHDQVSLRRVYRVLTTNSSLLNRHASSTIIEDHVARIIATGKLPVLTDVDCADIAACSYLAEVRVEALRGVLLCRYAGHFVNLVTVCSLLTGEVLHVLHGHTDTVSCLAVPCMNTCVPDAMGEGIAEWDAYMVLTGSVDCTVRVWSSASCKAQIIPLVQSAFGDKGAFSAMQEEDAALGGSGAAQDRRQLAALREQQQLDHSKQREEEIDALEKTLINHHQEGRGGKKTQSAAGKTPRGGHGGVGAGAGQHILRQFCSVLTDVFKLRSSWRDGEVVGIYDGRSYCKVDSFNTETTEVTAAEVWFPHDGSVKAYSNLLLLRNPAEASFSPCGPPLWSQPSVPVAALGSKGSRTSRGVAVFELDPELCVQSVLRQALSFPNNGMVAQHRPLSISQFYTYFSALFGEDYEDLVAGSLVALMNTPLPDPDAGESTAIEQTPTLSLAELLLRLFAKAGQPEDRVNSKPAHRCDKLLRHRHPVRAINYSPASKVVVSIDDHCNVFMWDALSLFSTSSSGGSCLLSVTPHCTQLRTPLLPQNAMSAPVAGTQLLTSQVFGSTFAQAATNVLTVSDNVSAPKVDISCVQLNVPAVNNPNAACSSSSFPLFPRQLLAAYAIEDKHAKAEVARDRARAKAKSAGEGPAVATMRALIYVRQDFSTYSVQVSSFMPEMVALSNSRAFLSCVDQSSRTGMHADTADASTASVLQQVYFNRANMLRVVYAVSSIHSSLDELTRDLVRYSVIQRGYNTTPSELIDICCFERNSAVQKASSNAMATGAQQVESNSSWLTNSLASQRYASCATKTTSNRSVRSGVVIEYMQLQSVVTVALDYCNDIIHVKCSAILSLFDEEATGAVQLLEQGDPPTGNKYVGRRVQFEHTPANARLPGNVADDVCDVFYVSVTGASMVRPGVLGQGKADTLIFPVVVGRSSFPVCASSALTAPLAHSMANSIQQAFLTNCQYAIGKYNCNMQIERVNRNLWVSAHTQHIRRAVTSFDAAGPAAAPRLNSLLFAQDYHVGLYSYFMLYKRMAGVGTPDNHPLLQYINTDILCGVGQMCADVCKRQRLGTLSVPQDAKTPPSHLWWDLLDEVVCNNWLMRSSVRVDEALLLLHLLLLRSGKESGGSENFEYNELLFRRLNSFVLLHQRDLTILVGAAKPKKEIAFGSVTLPVLLEFAGTFPSAQTQGGLDGSPDTGTEASSTESTSGAGAGEGSGGVTSKEQAMIRRQLLQLTEGEHTRSGSGYLHKLLLNHMLAETRDSQSLLQVAVFKASSVQHTFKDVVYRNFLQYHVTQQLLTLKKMTRALMQRNGVGGDGDTQELVRALQRQFGAAERYSLNQKFRGSGAPSAGSSNELYSVVSFDNLSSAGTIWEYGYYLLPLDTTMKVKVIKATPVSTILSSATDIIASGAEGGKSGKAEHTREKESWFLTCHRKKASKNYADAAADGADLGLQLQLYDIIMKFKVLLLTLQSDSDAPVVRCVDSTVSFIDTVSTTSTSLYTLEWSKQYKSLKYMCDKQGGGLLNRGHYDVFKVLAHKLVSAVMLLANSSSNSANSTTQTNISLFSLNPNTIIMDAGSDDHQGVLLLGLPTMAAIPIKQIQSAISSTDGSINFEDIAFMLQTYVSAYSNNEVIMSCVPKFGLDNFGVFNKATSGGLSHVDIGCAIAEQYNTSSLDDEGNDHNGASSGTAATAIAALPLLQVWDIWATGASLFFMAFGTPIPCDLLMPVISSEHVAAVSSTTVTEEILAALWTGLFCAKMDQGQGRKAVSSVYMKLDAIEAVSHHAPGSSGAARVPYLRKLRQAMQRVGASSASSSTMNDRVQESLFEQLTMHTFHAVYTGPLAFIALDTRLLHFGRSLHGSGGSAEKILEQVQSFLKAELQLSLTLPEVEFIVDALSANAGGDGDASLRRTVMEKVAVALKTLSLMLSEMNIYGLFTQLLCAVTHCLSAVTIPPDQPVPTLVDIMQHYPFLNATFTAPRSTGAESTLGSVPSVYDDSVLAKCTGTLQVLTSPYKDVTEFIETVFVVPLTHTLETIYLGESDATSVSSPVEVLSVLMSLYEELLLMASTEAIGDSVDGDHSPTEGHGHRHGHVVGAIGHQLSLTNVNPQWLREHYVEILVAIAGSHFRILEALTTACQRFYATCVVPAPATSSTGTDTGIRTGLSSSSKGVSSIGSKLIARLVTFLQNVAEAVVIVSNHINFVANASDVSSLYATAGGGVDGGDGGTTDASMLHRRLQVRGMCDSIFHTLCSACYTLFLSSSAGVGSFREFPLPFSGGSSDNILDHFAWLRTTSTRVDQFALTCGVSGMGAGGAGNNLIVSKLIEPLLVHHLLGDDGKGYIRNHSSTLCMKHAETLLTNHHVLSLSSRNITPSDVISTSSVMSPTPVFCLTHPAVQYRGQGYIVCLYRLNQNMKAVEVALNAMVSSGGSSIIADKAKLTLATSTLLLIQPPITTEVKEKPAAGGRKQQTQAVAPRGAVAEQEHALQALAGAAVHQPVLNYPDAGAMQRLQAIVDLQLPSYLQSLLASEDLVLRLTCFKVCLKMLSWFHSASDDANSVSTGAAASLAHSYEYDVLHSCEPFVSLSELFTSHAWVSSIVDTLRHHKKETDVVQAGLQCLKYMAKSLYWMRTWALYNVIPTICMLLASYPAGAGVGTQGQINAAIRRECLIIIGGCKKVNPMLIELAIAVRIPHIESVLAAGDSSSGGTGWVRPSAIRHLLAASNDLCFGSTLSEQVEFSKELLSWTDSVFTVRMPSFQDSLEELMDLELTTQRLTVLNEGVDIWECLFQIVLNVLSWMPRLCQGIDTLFSSVSAHGSTPDATKSRSNLTYFILTRQISFIERVLVYSIYYEHPRHVAMILTVFCGSSASSLHNQDGEHSTAMEQLVAQREQSLTSVFQVMEDIATVRAYKGSSSVESTLITLKLLCTFVKLTSNIVHCVDINHRKECALAAAAAGGESQNKQCKVLNLLCSSGLLTTCLRFHQICVEMIRENGSSGSGAAGSGRNAAAFAKFCPELLAVMRHNWIQLLACNNDEIVKEIVELGYFRIIMQDWLADTHSSMAAATSTGTHHDWTTSLVVRHEAFHMLTAVADFATSTEPGVRLAPHVVNKLYLELAKWTIDCSTVANELGFLQGGLGQGLGTTKSTTKGTAKGAHKMLKASAVSVLALLCSLPIESVYIQYQYHGVPEGLMVLTKMYTPQHPYSVECWAHWSHAAAQKKTASSSAAELPAAADDWGALDHGTVACPQRHHRSKDKEEKGKEAAGREKPLALHGQLVEDTVRKLWRDEKADTENLGLSRTTTKLLKDIDSNELLAAILDQLGDYVVNIKQRFDIVAGANTHLPPELAGTVTQEQVIGLCLDLGLRSGYLANIVRDCDALLAVKTKFAQASRDNVAEVDSITFSEFVTMYGTQYMKQQEDQPFNPFKTDDKHDKSAVVVGGRRYDETETDENGPGGDEEDGGRRHATGDDFDESAQMPSENKLKR